MLKPHKSHAGVESRPALELAMTDGLLTIQLSGLLTAWDRRVRRWRQAWFWTVTLVVVGLAVAVIVLVPRWDYTRSRGLSWMRVEIREARQEALCWRALALHLPASRAEIVPVGQRGAWVAECAARELRR